MQIRPAEKTPCPVAFPGFMIRKEFMVVDGAIGFIHSVGSIRTSIICQSRGYGYACARKDHC